MLLCPLLLVKAEQGICYYATSLAVQPCNVLKLERCVLSFIAGRWLNVELVLKRQEEG